MVLNKNDARLNLKLKKDSKFDGKRPSNVSLQSTKLRSDGMSKPTLEYSTTAPLRSRKLHNCLQVGISSNYKKPQICLKRKSISLVELTCHSKIWTPRKLSKEQGDEPKIKNILENTSGISYASTVKEYNLASKACKMFILHAWRKRRTQVTALQSKSQRLENEVQNLNIQTVVLRNLLESEKLRVAIALSDSSHLKGRLEHELNTTKELRKDLSDLETEKSKSEQMQAQMQLEINLLMNELTMAKDDIRKLHEDSSRTRNELLASREAESELLSKLGVAEAHMRDKISCLQEMKKRAVQCQAQITEQAAKIHNMSKERKAIEKEINKAICEIRKKDSELNNFQNNRKVQNENIVNLKKDIIVSKNKIEHQATIIHSLEDTINKYKTEREEAEENRIKLRNRAVFEAINICANLFLPRNKGFKIF